MAGWLREGRRGFDRHVGEWMENGLPAFLRLFSGSNDGKMILKI